MWEHSEKILKELGKTIPIASVYLMGSFTTKKRRPADVDVMVLIQAKAGNKNEKWATDLILAPDNEYGNSVVEDAKKWMKQKYGAKKSAVIKLK